MQLATTTITVQAVRIGDKKISAAVLEQFEICSILEYIAKHKLYDFSLETYDVNFICRVSAVPILKSYRSHLSRTYQFTDHVDRSMERYQYVDQFGFWEFDNEVRLHPIGTEKHITYSSYSDEWLEVNDEFEYELLRTPKAFIGV